MSKSNKVLYVSNIDISLSKGPSVNEIEFIDALIRHADVEVEVYVPKLRNELRSELRDYVTEITDENIENKNILSIIKTEYALYKKFISLANDHTCSAIFTRVSVFPISLFLTAKRLEGRYYVKTMGDGEFRFFKSIRVVGVFIAWLHSVLFKRIIKHAKAVDVVTDTHKLSLENNLTCHGKVHVVSNKVNTNIFYPRERDSILKKHKMEQYDYIIGYVGNDPLKRGAKELIFIINKLRNEYRVNVGGVIVGDFKIENKKDLDHINCFGQVEYSLVPEIMCLLDVGVSFLPKWHRGACEQKVRQYIATGVVPIVTPGGSSFVEDAGVGYVFENDDLDKLTTEVLNILKNENLADKKEKCVIYANEELTHKKLATERLKVFNAN